MKKIIINIMKVIIVTSAVLILLSIIYFLSAFILSRISIDSIDDTRIKEIDIYLISNGFHSDIVVPIKSKEMDWSEMACR